MPLNIGSLKLKPICLSLIFCQSFQRCYNNIPFYDLYQNAIGHPVSEYMQAKFKKKYPSLEMLSQDRLQCSLQILKKFSIDVSVACSNPHVFCINPISMDNYGEILRECGFVNIMPNHLIRYRTLVKSRTIAQHKREGLMRDDIQLEEKLQECFKNWPLFHKIRHNFPDSSTSILTVRLSVLESYLTWKLKISPDEFKKYCQNYLPLKHKPMHDIQEALNIAENEIKFDVRGIRRNGFIISADPTNTKLILEHVDTLAGIDIRDAIRIEPAILKNNYKSLLQIRDILEEYRIPQDAQRRCLKVFCMCPKSVRERLNELKNLKEYNILSTNPRVLSMVIHKRKMMNRLSKIQAARKQCYSLNHLVSSSKVFNDYISSFGNKVCGRDIAVLITSSLEVLNNSTTSVSEDPLKFVLSQLRRHKFWLHAALNVVDENIYFLKQRFQNEVILKNCQILLYPVLSFPKVTNDDLFNDIDDFKHNFLEMVPKLTLVTVVNNDKHTYTEKHILKYIEDIQNLGPDIRVHHINIWPYRELRGPTRPTRCYILDLEQYIEVLLYMRDGRQCKGKLKLDAVYGSLKCEHFTDDQVLSLVLYEIEKKYHFSGDGIWTRQDGVKVESHC